MTDRQEDPGFGVDENLLQDLQLDLAAESDRNGLQASVDLWFYVFLRRFSRFGYFNFGPITIDVRMIAAIIERTAERVGPGGRAYGEDFVRFSVLVADERRRSGQRRIDELHLLLAFMRVEDGLPARVFGELGVTREDVERFARAGGRAAVPAPVEEKLFSPEEAADYLGGHVQTVRGWIRSGRLRASRLAGQRALRIAASDIQSVLEPVDPGDA
jgi:excisionase family DNA binding protein